MTKTRKILIWTLLGYVVLTVLAFIVFGSAGRNEDFAPQDEFTLYTWINLPGSLDINKAVLYLVLSGILTSGRCSTSPGGCRRARTASRPPSRCSSA